MAKTGLLSLAAAGLSTMASAAFPLGCTSTGVAYSDTIANMSLPLNTSTAEACQEECVAIANCTNFGYYPGSGECWLADSAVLEMRTTAHADVIAGPKVCEEPAPSCTEFPAASFPGTDETVDWPTTGYQPQRLQCFPLTCDTVVTLESTVAGWTGACKELTEVTLEDDQTCEEYCLDMGDCPGYQVADDGSCWTGIGWNCDTTRSWDTDFQPAEAKRFMRGGVRVLKELVQMRVPELDMAFNATEMSILADPAKSCAEICYSILECEYWQLNNRTDTGGCWVDEKQLVPYPLLQTDMLAPEPQGTGYSHWVAGEFIQRTCPVTEVAAEEEQGPSFPIWLLCLLIALCVVCAAVAAYLIYTKFCVKTKKTSRATKRALKGPLVKAEEPSPAQPVQQQAQFYYTYPVQTTSYHVPVYQAAPVATVSREIPIAAAAPMVPVQTVAQPISPVVQYAAAPAQYVTAQPMMQFQTFDANNDGVITREEFMAAAAAAPRVSGA